ncbi:HAD-IIB family hydrolase [Gemmatimonadota bacterium]
MLTSLLLCTDLDRTLLPNGPQPESPDARQRFNQLVEHSGITLVYVTGRDRVLVEQAIGEYSLPRPAYVIADVGSTIHELQPADWNHWEKWEQEISPDWKGKTNAGMRSLFSEIPSLTLQQEAKQNSYKLSYYVALGIDHEALIAEMQAIIDRQFIRANLIWSIDEITATGLLDVLPASANKSHAIEFLMQQLGYDLSNTIFAGDSGNDLAVLCSPIRSVLVANASDEVRDQAEQLVSDMGQSKSLYFAEGGFLGMNGNYSAGILEGIAHYMPETKKIMDNS